jgi:hypothetical protein
VIATIPGFLTVAAGDVAVTVSTPTITFFSPTATVGAGLQDGAYALQLDASNHGGVTLRLQSSNPAVMRVSPNATTAGTEFIDIPLANGVTVAQYYLQGVEGAPVPTAVTLTATAPGFAPKTAAVTVVRPAVALSGLPSATTSLSPDDPFTVVVGVPISSNTAVSQQAVRVGGVAVQATVTNAIATVGQLVTSTQTAQAVTVTLAPGQQSVGGLAFDALGGGTSRVIATIPGFVTVAAGDVAVTVSTPTITFFSPTATVGAGLQDGAYALQLEASNHGGVTLRLQSSNPAVMRVSPNATTAGTEFIDIPLANGVTLAQYYLQGVEGAPVPATVTLTASAAGFSSRTASVTIVQPAVVIGQLSATTTTTAADDPFVVSVGMANADNTALSQLQSVRVGAAAFVISVTSAAPAVGRLVTGTAAGGLVSVLIVPGQTSSPASVATGGVAFDALTAGQTDVTVSSPGVRVLTSATIRVTVSP